MLAFVFTIGCSRPTRLSLQDRNSEITYLDNVRETASCDPTAASSNRALPLFSKPFAGDFPVANMFDHDKPSVDYNGSVLTMCGARDANQVDGHDGYDWVMPEGTPIRAVADGIVMFAGLNPPGYCAQLGRIVSAIEVQLRHRAPDGTGFSTLYGNLSSVRVVVGDVIPAGATIGLSGNTGCSTAPHLHFSTYQDRGGSFIFIDPYGWHQTASDPWEADPRGAASVWLWRDGEAPRFRF